MTLKRFDEYSLLKWFYDVMIEQGRPVNLVRLSIDAKFIDEFVHSEGVEVSEEEVRRCADICLANGWIQQAAIGSGQYSHLQMTTAGFGAIKSKLMQQQRLASRSMLRKVSDFIVDHRGLLLLLGAVVALVGLFLNLMRDS